MTVGLEHSLGAWSDLVRCRALAPGVHALILQPQWLCPFGG